jgi:dynein heavy chain
MYLDPIFSAEDIQRQLPVEAKIFSEVDQFWREFMQKIKAAPRVLAVSTGAVRACMCVRCSAD